LINPGSCGEALDFDNRAAYTLLEYADGAWEIDERRVAYDVDKTAEALRESALAACAPEFARVIERQLLSGRENFWPFLMHLNETAHKNGQPHSPVSNEVWALAVSTYDFTG
jgi:hypothetical protein